MHLCALNVEQSSSSISVYLGVYVYCEPSALHRTCGMAFARRVKCIRSMVTNAYNLFSDRYTPNFESGTLVDFGFWIVISLNLYHHALSIVHYNCIVLSSAFYILEMQGTIDPNRLNSMCLPFFHPISICYYFFRIRTTS